MNRPVRKMVLERIVPGGTGFGANRPVTQLNNDICLKGRIYIICKLRDNYMYIGITNRINEHIKTQDNIIWINDVTGLTLGKGMGGTNLDLINFSKLHMRKKIMLKLSCRETTEARSQNLEWE